MTTTIPIRDRIACSIAEACSHSGLGRTTIYSRIRTGELITRKIGRRTLIMVDSLLALLDAPEDTRPRHLESIAARQKEPRR